MLAAYYVIRPVRDQLSAAVGSTALPIFYAVTFVVTLALAPLFGALVARYPRRSFVPVVYLFFLLGMLAFIPLFQMQEAIGARLLGSIFFVWVSVFNLFVVAVFWSFMADLFDAEQAHRLFPVIALGGTLGAIAGPALTRALERGRSAYPACWSCPRCCSASPSPASSRLSRWSRRNPVAGDEQRDTRVIGGSFIAGAIETLKSPLMRRLAILMLLGDAVGTVIYALLADYSGATYATRAARINFSANVDFYANLLQIVLQLGVTRALLVRFGPAPALALDGCIKAIMLAGLAIFAGAVDRGRRRRHARQRLRRVQAGRRFAVYARRCGDPLQDQELHRYLGLALRRSRRDQRIQSVARLGTTVPGFALLAMIAAGSSAWIGWRAARMLLGTCRERPTSAPTRGDRTRAVKPDAYCAASNLSQELP